MYEELIKRLRYAASYDERIVIQDCKEAADAIEEMQKCIDGIEADNDSLCEQLRKSEADNINLTGWLAEENAKHQWIPVTERLPGRDWVLCKCRENIHEVLSLRGGYWYHDPLHQYMSGFVTHWMPLPQPPTEDE